MQIKGRYVDVEWDDTKPDTPLRLTITEDGRAEIAENPDKCGEDLLWHLMEDIICNSSFGNPSPDKVVALTDSPLLSWEYEIDDDGNYIETPSSRLWWFPEYMIRDYKDDLIAYGVAVFTSA